MKADNEIRMNRRVWRRDSKRSGQLFDKTPSRDPTHALYRWGPEEQDQAIKTMLRIWCRATSRIGKEVGWLDAGTEGESGAGREALIHSQRWEELPNVVAEEPRSYSDTGAPRRQSSSFYRVGEVWRQKQMSIPTT